MFSRTHRDRRRLHGPTPVSRTEELKLREFPSALESPRQSKLVVATTSSISNHKEDGEQFEHGEETKKVQLSATADGGLGGTTGTTRSRTASIRDNKKHGRVQRVSGNPAPSIEEEGSAQMISSSADSTSTKSSASMIVVGGSCGGAGPARRGDRGGGDHDDFGGDQDGSSTPIAPSRTTGDRAHVDLWGQQQRLVRKTTKNDNFTPSSLLAPPAAPAGPRKRDLEEMMTAEEEERRNVPMGVVATNTSTLSPPNDPFPAGTNKQQKKKKKKRSKRTRPQRKTVTVAAAGGGGSAGVMLDEEEQEANADSTTLLAPDPTRAPRPPVQEEHELITDHHRLMEEEEETKTTEQQVEHAVFFKNATEYACGIALRNDVLMPILNDPNLPSVYPADLIRQIPELFVQYAHGDIIATSAYPRNNIVAVRIERMKCDDSMQLSCWWELDRVLPFSSREWHEWWLRRCCFFDDGCEMVKVVLGGSVIVGVAYIERNIIDRHSGKGEGESKLRVTLIRGIRLHPHCSRYVQERLRLNNTAGGGHGEEEAAQEHSFVRLKHIAHILLCHILFKSIRYGAHGVAVNSPKDATVEKFYEEYFGAALLIGEDGRRFYRISPGRRMVLLKESFEKQLALLSIPLLGNNADSVLDLLTRVAKERTNKEDETNKEKKQRPTTTLLEYR